MSQPSVDLIFKAAQEEASPALWSQGVTLTRGGTQFLCSQRDSGSELLIHVRTPARAVAYKVNLWPKTQDWDCDCGSSVSPCAHVIAALIQLKKGELTMSSESEAISSSDAVVEYHFRKLPVGLVLERHLSKNAERRPLKMGLTQYLGFLQSSSQNRLAKTQAEELWAVSVTKADLAIDQILRSYQGASLERPRIEALFKTFLPDQKIFYDGKLVQIASEVLTVRAECVDEADGYRIRRIKNPTVLEVFTEGIAYCQGDVLKLVAPFNRNSVEAQWVQGEGTFWGLEKEEELCRNVIPQLQKKLVLEVKSLKLPQNIDLDPRIEIQSSLEDTQLVIVCHLVYGDPPLFKLNPQNYQLQPYDGKVPTRVKHLVNRKPADERRLLAELQSDLQLQIARPIRFEGSEAIVMAQKLKARGVGGKGLERFVPADEDLKFEWKTQVVSQTGTYQVEAELKSGQSSVSFEQAYRSWEQGESHVRLMDGSWAKLPKDWFSKFGRRIQDFLLLRNIEKEISTARVPEICALSEELGVGVPDSLRRLRTMLDQVESIQEFPLPRDLTVSLRPYQRVGVNWLQFLKKSQLGALLADDMGLGKTLQTLCAIEGRTLVIAPTSVVFNWASEIKKFRPHVKVHVYHGGTRSFPSFDSSSEGTEVLLTSYGVLRLDIEKFIDRTWDAIVVDEGQNIKNPDSLAAQAVRRLKANFRVLLSGTPVENRLDDLWSQFEFLNPGLLGSRKRFSEEISRPMAAGDADAALKLRTRIKPFLLRRLKKDVAKDLPPRTEVILNCELSESEREVYNAIFASTKKEVLAQLEGASGSVIQALESILRLRQACCHPALIPGQASLGHEEAFLSAKLSTFFDHFEEARAAGHKALIFSQWTSLLDLIQKEFEKRSYSFLRIDGSTQNRQSLVDQFQNENKTQAMLISLKAGGVGLTLTAADHVYVMDPWWNPAVEDQAADRAHRIGQLNPVLVHKLVAKDTIEERILELQQRKRELAAAVLEGAQGAASLTRDDILSLLS